MQTGKMKVLIMMFAKQYSQERDIPHNPTPPSLGWYSVFGIQYQRYHPGMEECMGLYPPNYPQIPRHSTIPGGSAWDCPNYHRIPKDTLPSRGWSTQILGYQRHSTIQGLYTLAKYPWIPKSPYHPGMIYPHNDNL